MANRNEPRRERRNRERAAATDAPSAAGRRGSPIWVIALAAIGGAAIAGAVVFEMQRPSAKPGADRTAPAPMPFTALPTSGGTPAYTPQPAGLPPPGKVWSPEHGHWHDLPPAAIPQ